MRDLQFYELQSVSGAIWCDYRGQPCSGCANLTWIDGDSCTPETKTEPSYMPNQSLLISSAVGTAIGFAISCIPGGPIGMMAGAMAGAALGAFGVVLYDAMEISKYY